MQQRPSRGGRDTDHLAPDAEGGVASGTMFVSGQTMVTELEVVVGWLWAERKHYARRADLNRCTCRSRPRVG